MVEEVLCLPAALGRAGSKESKSGRRGRRAGERWWVTWLEG